MTTEKTNDPKAFAEQVKRLGAELMGSHAVEELRELWRRLPNVVASPPKSTKAFVERVAMYMLELGDKAPQDIGEFIANAEPLRDFGPLSKSMTIEETQGSATEAQAQEDAKNEAEATAGHAGGEASPPTETKEDSTVQTHTDAGRKGRRAAPPALPKSKGKKAKQAAKAAPRNTDGKKAAAAPRGSGPRAGTICAMVIQLTKDGKSTEQTAKLVAKAFPGTEFQKKADKGDNTLVSWYRNYARNKGWLPRSED